MRKSLQYSTKYIDKNLEYKRLRWENEKQGIYEENFNMLETTLQRLDERIKEHQYDLIFNSFNDLHRFYSRRGDIYFRIEVDIKKAKENHYLAALASELCYAMVAKGFPRQCLYHYDFKEENISYSKNAILANEYELALKITGEDTIEGALILQDYERACAILPKLQENDPMYRDELTRCMWAIAHNEEELFNQYMRERIKALRRQGSIMATITDSWGLAVLKLARQRGMSCYLDVIELPQHLLDDTRIDTSGLSLPRADEVRGILNEGRYLNKG